MKKSSILGVIAVIVVIVAVVIAARSTTKPSVNPPAKTSASPAPSASTSSAPVTMDYSDAGFSPATLTVKAGGEVIFKNSASDGVQINSDPHPVHTDDPDLNIGPIAAGQSKTVTLNKVGTFGFHNHLNPSERASITIQ